ncbi:MAG: hypothetical protein FWD53_04365 [Phycisphaerales bacterium]|nr:hypothetical protein [Phycisphaerales bacterium]
MRKILDEYLDGQLATAECAKVQERLAEEPELRRMLERMVQERALRTAAFESFDIDERKAAVVTAKVMATIQQAAPIGHVGLWVRRITVAAAILLLVAGSYLLGMKSARTQLSAEPQVVVRVMYYDDAGEKQVSEFHSLDAADAYISRVDVRRASMDMPSADMDINRSGAF